MVLEYKMFFENPLYFTAIDLWLREFISRSLNYVGRKNSWLIKEDTSLFIDFFKLNIKVHYRVGLNKGAAMNSRETLHHSALYAVIASLVICV